MTALETDDGIIPIPVIENTLRLKEDYYRRKPLTGENTSRGVIVTDRYLEGEITTRLTNQTAPHLLYLITGKITDEHHIPETRSLFQQTLEIDPDNLPEFSILEQEGDKLYRTKNLKATKFTMIQELDTPLKLTIKAEALEERTEIPYESIPTINQPRYFFFNKKIGIEATLYNEIIVTIDSLEEIFEGQLTIKAKTMEEYEPNRNGVFQIITEILWLSEIIGNTKKYYTYRYHNKITKIKVFLNI